MNLRGIVSVTGKPGLSRVIGQNKAGFILETMDGLKNKLITNASTKLATLEDITVFGDQEEDITLISILEKMKTAAATNTVPDPKADNKILRNYFTSIVPNHDVERVYASDIKKIISWYVFLATLPLFDEAAPVANEAAESDV
jgi:hypothetical protein